MEPRAAGLWEALAYASQDLGVQEYALSRALQLNPKQVTAWVRLGNVYLAIGAAGMADMCFEKARFHDPENVAVWQGQCLLQCQLLLAYQSVWLLNMTSAFDCD